MQREIVAQRVSGEACGMPARRAGHRRMFSGPYYEARPAAESGGMPADVAALARWRGGVPSAVLSACALM